MKKFWRWLNGQWFKLKEFKLENWIYLPLMVFFYLMVICLLLLDLAIFAYRQIERFFIDLSKRMVTKIKKTKWPEMVKNTLETMINWSITGLLMIIILIVFSIKSLTTYRGVPLSQQISFLPELFKPELIEEILQTPNEINWATSEAIIRITEKEIKKLVKQAEEVGASSRGELSQKEMVNIALAYYYDGQQAQYKQWLEWGRTMDPNEIYLKK